MAEIITNQNGAEPIWVDGYSEYEADIFPEILQEYLGRYRYTSHDISMFFRLVQRKVKQETIEQWLYGETIPDFEDQLVLAKILNVPCGKIFAAVRNRKDVQNENVKEN